MPASAAALAEKISTIKRLRTSEADFHNHLRDLLTQRPFGLGLRPQQIQVDTANLPGSRRRPDIAVFETQDGQASCTPDHMVAVLELKRSDVLTRSLASVFKEKRDYIQPATR